MTDNELSELTTGECHDLLDRHHFGRLAFLDRVGVMPMIIPVNYLFHNGTVVFRTDPGSKLTAALHDAPVEGHAVRVEPLAFQCGRSFSTWNSGGRACAAEANAAKASVSR